MTIGVWARRLRQASFRGEPFFIDSHEFGTGRNTVDHETPGQDRTYSEDMGRKTRVFKIEGHVLGDDVFRLRDNLIDACEQEGSGTLIHPYLGTKTVQCKTFSFREDTRQGRIATFTMEFVEAGEPSFPAAIFDKVAEFFDAANNAVDAVNSAFETAYSVLNAPGFVVTEATVVIENALNTVNNALEKVRTAPDKRAELQAKIDTLLGRKEELARDSVELRVEITNAIKDLKDSVADPEETDAVDVESGADNKLSVMDNLVSFNDDAITIVTGTPSQQQQAKNELAITNLVQQNAIISLSEASVVKDYKTIQDAEKQRESLIDLMENVIENTDDDAVFQAFSDLKAKMIETVPNAAITLASEVSVEIATTQPTLALIYELNGDIDEEQDFINRNKIRNPGFVGPGGYTAVNG